VCCIQHTAAEKASETLITSSHRKEARVLQTLVCAAKFGGEGRSGVECYM